MKILMVCLGNICRSPMAEGVFRHQAKLARLQVEVDSAGTAGYHVGETPDKRAIRNMKSHGIDISTLHARQFKPADFDEFDRIYTMDNSNYSDILRLAKNQNQRSKVELILEISYPGEFRSVPDPYYGEIDGFELVYDLLNAACAEIISDLK